jgi:hypothetical protein
MLSVIAFLFIFSVYLSFFFSISCGVMPVFRKRICRGSVTSLESWIIQEQVTASSTLASAPSSGFTVSQYQISWLPGFHALVAERRILQIFNLCWNKSRAYRTTFHVNEFNDSLVTEVKLLNCKIEIRFWVYLSISRNVLLFTQSLMRE